MKRTLLFLIVFVCSVNLFSQVDMKDHIISLKLYDEASISIKKGSFNEAIGKLVEAISLDSLNRAYYIGLYQACFNTTNYNLVLPYLESATHIFLEDDEIFYYTGNIYSKLGNIEQAILNYDSAIIYSKINGEGYPLVYAYHLNRGNCYLKLDEYKCAMVDYNYALKLNDKDGVLFINRGIANYKLEELEKACLDWKLALSMGFTSANEYIDKYCY